MFGLFDVPDPLHPALVHLPLGLAVVLPLFALLGALLVARGALPLRAWCFVLVTHALVVGGAYVASETGEEQEERVEDVVPESALHEHEERAELFLRVSAGALLVTGAGLLAGPVGSAARAGAVLATLVMLGLGIRTGESGGHLVYEHGAANAYLEKAPASVRSQGHPD